MQYEVIRYFIDAQDDDYAYREGDTYPRDGLNVSDARIRDLLSGNNFQRVALIKRVLDKPAPKKSDEKVENKVQESVSYTAEEIQKMPYMKLKSVAKQNGVEVKDKEASDIRSELIEKLGL